jgi:hypothetical protein
MQAEQFNPLIIKRQPGGDWAPTLDLDRHWSVVVAGNLASCRNEMLRKFIDTVLG